MIKVLELFAGIGAASKALERMGVEHEIVDAVEIDKYAIKSFNAIHGTNFEPQDITKWNKDIEADLIIGGFPCQDISVAGVQKGIVEGETRSGLMYEMMRIIEKIKPKYIITENVKNILSAKHKPQLDVYIHFLEKLGYTVRYKVLNAEDYGVPQHRERIFIVGIMGDRAYSFPEPKKLSVSLYDILDDTVDDSYYVTDNMLNYFMGVGQRPSKYPRKERFLSNINRKKQNIANSITTNAGQRPTDNFIKVIDDMYKNRAPKEYIDSCPTLRSERYGLKVVAPGVRLRKLTETECWKLMGFDKEDCLKAKKAGVSRTQLFKQAGNSIVVDVIGAVLKELLWT